jgi:diguanylate cyclase (GGDEF)-like protein
MSTAARTFDEDPREPHLEPVGRAWQVIRLLVVDDDPQAGSLMEIALHDAPFDARIETVSTYAGGLERVLKGEHDVYLIDYRLPDGTGTGLIHEAREGGIEKPFILITGYGNWALDEVAFREGAADYIEKDQIERQLKHAIRYALRDWENAQALKKAYQEAWATSVRDSLTGCFNRKHALEVMDRELRRSSRLKTPVSVVMFDLDDFKGVNDRFGHLCGDAMLRTIGERLRSALRGSDLICRYGGDEFLLVFPDTPAKGARHAIATLRRDFLEHPLVWHDPRLPLHDERLPIKASFGITTVKPGDMDVPAIIARADAALYRAKARRGDGGTIARSTTASAGETKSAGFRPDGRDTRQD